MKKTPAEIGMNILMGVVLLFGLGAGSFILLKAPEPSEPIELAVLTPEALAELSLEADAHFEGHPSLPLPVEVPPSLKRTPEGKAALDNHSKAVTAKPSTKKAEAETPVPVEPSAEKPKATAKAAAAKAVTTSSASKTLAKKAVEPTSDEDVIAKPAAKVPEATPIKKRETVVAKPKQLGADWTELKADKSSASPSAPRAAAQLAEAKAEVVKSLPSAPTKVVSSVIPEEKTPVPTASEERAAKATPLVRTVEAPPLVPEVVKPSIVMASPAGDKVWVKLDAQTTVIVSKGDEVPGLGVFNGMDGKTAKFGKGSLSLN